MAETKRPAYGVQVCECLTAQLAKSRTLNAYQLAGHIANIEFWHSEVRHCLEIVDGYSDRFDVIRLAQQAYVKQHRVQLFNLDEPYITQGVPPPRKVPKADRTTARENLCAAWLSFMTRASDEGVIDRDAARKTCASLDIEWNQ